MCCPTERERRKKRRDEERREGRERACVRATGMDQ
jgi:hypothetical protein